MSSGVIRADIQHDRARAFEAWQAERAAVDEPVPLDRMTVADAVQTALLYNQTLQSAVLEKEVARGQVVSALVVVAPTVSAGSTLSDGTDDARHVLDVTARQPLFRAGGATAALAYAGWMRARVAVRPMDEIEARQLLGVGLNANVDEINAAHRRLIAQVHPDRGGTAELARRVNAARDLLLGQVKADG